MLNHPYERREKNFFNMLGIDLQNGRVFETIWLKLAQVYRTRRSLKCPSIVALVSEQLGTHFQE